MSFIGSEHAHFLRHLSTGIASAISREEHFWNVSDPESPRLVEWRETIQPAFIGSGIVTSIALVEHLIGKNSDRSWKIPSNWYGKKEFNNFRSIRHCFAHDAGSILPNRKRELESFLQLLNDGAVLDRKNDTIQPYYTLSALKIIPSPSALLRLRLLATELLAEKGLIEKWY